MVAFFERILLIFQIIKQFFGLLYLIVRYEDNMPLPENYVCMARYILPFEGMWVTVNGGVTEDMSHSWDILTQRFAYDFIVIDESGSTLAGDMENPADYYCYGLDIIAPADGEVVHVEDRCADSIIDKDGNAHCNSRDLCGNHIVIKHAEGEFSFLAHLMQGSIAVKVGDVVAQGQRIAKCGNTGNSSQPHLHFHLQNKKSFFTSIGLPIEFTSIEARACEVYHILDPREAQGGFVEVAGRKYIGRGLEVRNAVCGPQM